jgi:general secretion pathway protein G
MKKRGFSLIEIIVVILIIGILGGIVGQSVFKWPGKAKLQVAKTNISTISDALMMYYMEHNDAYPTMDGGLISLVTKPAGDEDWGGPYIINESILTDPWGKKYNYKVPGDSGRGFSVWSEGRDGKEGGDEKIDKKISSK